MSDGMSRSYSKVHYALRPAKQVERRILVDGLQLLWASGFDIRSYKYIGMGSIHFVDFVMFHRHLGIKDMLSVELSDEIVKRVRFNAPYQGLIKTEVGAPIGDFLSAFTPDGGYLVWLDYDNVLSEEMLQDLSLACTTLPAGSILLVTVDTEPPGKRPYSKEPIPDQLEASRTYFQEIASELVYPFPKSEAFAYDSLPQRNIQFLHSSIEAVFDQRDERFQLLFNFLYADGHRMLTIGGMVTDHRTRRKLKSSPIMSQDYIRRTFYQEPFEIRVPVLTRREQLYLDLHMPCEDGWTPTDFELANQDVEDYRKIYRFVPSYAEVLL